MTRDHVYGTPLDQFEKDIGNWDEMSYRSRQIWHGVYHQLVSSFHELTTLPNHLIEKLQSSYRFNLLQEVKRSESQDRRTSKLLFNTYDGEQIETVLMTYDRRRTVCISTQSGCAMGCAFCATGQMGFRRNLNNGEIVEQVMIFARELKAVGKALTNLVVMGMGEPFHNYVATMQALDTLNHPEGFRFGARRITISTVGLTPMIERFTAEHRRENLAVSLHAATQDLRDEIVPISPQYPLDELIQACRRYVVHSGRRMTFEWALIKDVNDGLDQAEELTKLISGINCHVNLIPMNPTAGYSQEASPPQRVNSFSEHVLSKGIPCTVRVRRGIDIAAGCGQLASETLLKK
jgi:23S rRNA (adenine2503-C2)-methyltransferase